jgi:hypothetical protein
MSLRDRGVPLGILPALLAIAVLGYFAGHAGSQGASAEQLQTAATATVVLDHPSGWSRPGSAPGIPELPIANAIALAPNGDAAHAGLLVGALPTSKLSPLPAKFVANLRGLPETGIVSLQEVQAYRYARLNIPGYDRMLTLFVIPNPHGQPTALACYASANYSTYLKKCEQIVATLTLVGQTQSYDLTPEAAYARRVNASVAVLDRERIALRRELGPQAAPATVHTVATRLAGGFAEAATSLSKLEPSFATGQIQTVLSGAILQTRDAYTALAAAAANESAPEYASARKRVYEAESNVNWALENFALLGYDPAYRVPGSSTS